ncbi:MAG: uncharacterized protein H6R19_1383 [Proteobacteria bacterium]|nr:uncharacterized protein [Pseudomonadota bacterium]
MNLVCRAVVYATLFSVAPLATAQEPVPPGPAVTQIKPVPPAAGKSHKSRRSASAPVMVQTPVSMDAYQQALFSLRTGRVSEAHAQLRERLREAPQDLAATRLLATLLLDSGQQTEAAQVLAAGLAQAPQTADLALSLARLQADQGLHAEALQTLEASAGSATQDADYIAFMAVLSTQTGQTTRAVALWQQALLQAPAHGSWWLALATAQQTVQDRAGARQSFEKALASTQLDESQQQRARKALMQLRD